MADAVHPRAAGWYRRLLVLALLGVVAAPAVSGALWFTQHSIAAVAQAPGPPAVTPSGSDGGAPATSVEGAAGPKSAGPDASALEDLLDRRSAAVAARDAGGWAATVDRTVPGLRDQQAAVFGRLLALRPASWRYEARPPDAGLTQDRRAALGAPAFLTHVVLTYRLAPDAPVIRRDQHLTLVWRGRWLVAGTDDGPQQRDVWDLGPVTVTRGARSVVVASTSADVPAARTAAEADAAAARVDALWGSGWPRSTVVQVPADLAGMAALLGRTSTAGLDQLAAVTTGERRTSGVPVSGPLSGGTGAVGAVAPGSASGDLVVIDPGAFAGLTAVGRGAVLTHELTHVATRAVVGTSPPVWVDEGFADYVAYLGTPLTTRDLAADVLASPQRVAALTDLPPDSAFDPAAGDVGAAYAEAWLAMRFVEREGGPAMVVDFYRAAAGLEPLHTWPRPAPVRPALAPHTPLERACYDVVGYPRPSFVRRWVAYVRSVARGA
jgi:hypothetical protein